MIIYNVTIKIIPVLADEWVQWMKKEHIPDMMATGCFTGCTFTRLLEIDETEGTTYCCQYFAETMDAYRKYMDQYSPELRKKGIGKWGDGAIAFRTLMEIVQ
jgi:hypothetical protein